MDYLFPTILISVVVILALVAIYHLMKVTIKEKEENKQLDKLIRYKKKLLQRRESSTGINRAVEDELKAVNKLIKLIQED